MSDSSVKDKEAVTVNVQDAQLIAAQNQYVDLENDPDMLQRDPPPTNWKRFLPEWLTSNSEHAKFIRKIDIIVLGYSILNSFIQTLDTSNISNAYVSGMKEDLNLYGNEYSLFSTFYSCGIIVGAVPLIISTTYVRPSIIMPTCTALWTLFVMCCAGAKSAHAIYALRFLIGVSESIAFPGFTALVTSWYRRDELAKRTVLYEIIGTNVSNMISGYIQAGLYKHNTTSLAAWRWLFIVDGIISIPVIILGYLLIPDTPADTKTRWLTEKEKRYAKKRMVLAGRKPVRKTTWKVLRQSFSTWHIYGFSLCYYLYGAYSWGDGYFNLWLQSFNKYSVEQLNNIPTASQGAAIVNAFIMSFLSDHFQHRPIFIVINMLICLIGNAFVAHWTAPTALKFVGYMMITTGYPAQALTMAWANEICQGNATTRYLVVAVGNTLVYSTNAWLQVVIFPSKDAPHYKAGYQVCAAFLGLGVLSVGVCQYLLYRDYRTGEAIRSSDGLPIYPSWEKKLQEISDEQEAELNDDELERGSSREKSDHTA